MEGQVITFSLCVVGFHGILLSQAPEWLFWVINPRRACAARVTVVGSVCLSVCLLLTSRMFFRLTKAMSFSAAMSGLLASLALASLSWSHTISYGTDNITNNVHMAIDSNTHLWLHTGSEHCLVNVGGEGSQSGLNSMFRLRNRSGVVSEADDCS